jgi:hypothetical protein
MNQAHDLVAMTYDVTSTFAGPVDADLPAAHEAVSRLDPLHSLAGWLSVLGIDGEATWPAVPVAPGILRAHAEPELAFVTVWRFGEPVGHARLSWTARLHSDGGGRTVLTVTVRARASSAAARRRLLASWKHVETLASVETRRFRRAVEDDVEERVAERAETGPVRLAAVAV